jgi:hypothetical protein
MDRAARSGGAIHFVHHPQQEFRRRQMMVIAANRMADDRVGPRTRTMS